MQDRGDRLLLEGEDVGMCEAWFSFVRDVVYVEWAEAEIEDLRSG